MLFIGDSLFVRRKEEQALPGGHLQALRGARAHLQAAREAGRQLEFFAEELRLAHAALAEITGEYTADDLLGAIFGQFCIGK